MLRSKVQKKASKAILQNRQRQKTNVKDQKEIRTINRIVLTEKTQIILCLKFGIIVLRYLLSSRPSSRENHLKTTHIGDNCPKYHLDNLHKLKKNIKGKSKSHKEN